MNSSPASETDHASPKFPARFLNAVDHSVEESIPWIIEKLLAEGEQMLVFGPPKVGKSQFALQLAMSVAMERPFLSWPVAHRKRVLYLNFEMGKRFFMLRVMRHYFHSQYAELEFSDAAEENEAIEEMQWLNSDGDTPPNNSLVEKINNGIKEILDAFVFK